jgi:inorganic triphosphatase YgiF
MPVEVELKFRAAGDDVLRRLAGIPVLGTATLGPPRTVDELDRYLDTDDRRMAAAGWACRLRTRHGSTKVSLKGPPQPSAEGEGPLHRRLELEAPASDDLDPSRWPASEARGLVDRLRGERSLVERLRLRQRRTEREVSLDRASLGVLSLDRVEVERDGAHLGTLHAVELEVNPGEEAGGEQLARLAEALHAIDGVEPDGRTKLEHALDLLGEP